MLSVLNTTSHNTTLVITFRTYDTPLAVTLSVCLDKDNGTTQRHHVAVVHLVRPTAVSEQLSRYSDLGHGSDTQGIGLRFLTWAKRYFSSSQRQDRLVKEDNQPPVTWVPGMKRTGRETEHSYTFTPAHAHRNNVKFPYQIIITEMA